MHQGRELTPAARAACGKAVRAAVPRESHARFTRPAPHADAGQNERDFAALAAGVAAGRIPAERGV